MPAISAAAQPALAARIPPAPVLLPSARAKSRSADDVASTKTTGTTTSSTTLTGRRA